jgi:hypothetical protein
MSRRYCNWFSGYIAMRIYPHDLSVLDPMTAWFAPAMAFSPA